MFRFNSSYFNGIFRDRWLAVWLFACVPILTAGFHFKFFPGSKVITTYGTAAAALAAAVASFVFIRLVSKIWLSVTTAELPSFVYRATTRSFLLATICSLLANLGPNAIGLESNGRFVRLAIWIAIFICLQLAAFLRADRRAWERIKQVIRGEQPIEWPDSIFLAIVAVFAAEIISYLDWPILHVTPFALAFNVAMLSSAIVMVWAVVGRGMIAATLTLLGYSLLIFANTMKVKYLYTALQPRDPSYLSELSQFKEYIQSEKIAVVVGTFALVIGGMLWVYRKSGHSLTMKARSKMLICGAAVFLTILSLPWIPYSEPVLKRLGVLELKGQSVTSVKRNGLLLELAMQLPESYLPPPDGYTVQEIERILTRHADASAPATSPSTQPVSLIVFFFESFINPQDFGRPLTRDVIPNFNDLKSNSVSGYAVTPRFASGSAESEFEFITGMSAGFLPANCCAYKHYLKHEIPSLATNLRQQAGHHSAAIKCVGPGFYNFREAYEHMQFDDFCYDQEFSNPIYDKFSGHLSDISFVEEMLRPLNQPPCLVVGENLGSHAPYHPHLMGDKPRFLDEDSNSASDRVETYLQAISRTDEALGQMVATLQQRTDRVVLLVVGDHHPPFDADCRAYDVPSFQTLGPEGELFRRRTPFIIWKNFDEEVKATSPQQTTVDSNNEKYISLNFLPLLMLREAGLQPDKLFAINQQLYEQCPVVSGDLFFTQGRAKSFRELSPELQELVRDYELLQYDMLLGNNYAEQYWKQPGLARLNDRVVECP